MDIDRIVCKITTRREWEAAQQAGELVEEGLDPTVGDGFIHCASGFRLIPTLEKWFADTSEELVVLVLDDSKLASDLRWDPMPSAPFPHVYGPINLEAVKAAHPVRKDSTGRFVHPFYDSMPAGS